MKKTTRKIKRNRIKLTDEQRQRYKKLAAQADSDMDDVRREAKARQEEFADVMTSLKRTREEAGMSLTELSEQTGIHKSNLSLLENQKGNPTLETVKRIADALGVEILITVR